jgi:hypothetical protein
MKLFSRLQTLKPITKIILIALVLVVGVGGWMTYDNVRPRPLGSQMEYLGKEDYGNILGFDSKPGSVYYYATDINKEELRNYFNATYENLDGLAFPHANFTNATGKSFLFIYEDMSPFKSTKKISYPLTLLTTKPH